MFSSARPLALLLSTAALSGPGAFAQAGADVSTDKLPLRVLVTGVPGSERLADFETFLGEYFETVGTVSYSAFTPDKADAFDVVVFDAKITPSPRSIGLPARPKIPKNFARASVLIGGPGVMGVGEALDLKIDWL